MFWATTTFKVAESTPELSEALRAWKQHIAERHRKITEARSYRYDGGTSYVWQEGFEDFNAYQGLIQEEDELCATVMQAVFRHVVPGSREGKIWSDGL